MVRNLTSKIGNGDGTVTVKDKNWTDENWMSHVDVTASHMDGDGMGTGWGRDDHGLKTLKVLYIQNTLHINNDR